MNEKTYQQQKCLTFGNKYHISKNEKIEIDITMPTSILKMY